MISDLRKLKSIRGEARGSVVPGEEIFKLRSEVVVTFFQPEKRCGD